MDLAAISFSLQSETMFFVDEYGVPLRNSISWMDNRAVEQAEYLTAKYGDEVCYQHTGQISFAANWPVAKALWVKQNEPEVFSKTRKILLIEDFIIFQLTAAMCLTAPCCAPPCTGTSPPRSTGSPCSMNWA